MLRSIHYGPLVFHYYILNRRGRHITYVAPLKVIKEWLSSNQMFASVFGSRTTTRGIEFLSVFHDCLDETP